MAKGHDHEVVGALGTQPKATTWKIEIEICEAPAFKCVV